MYITVKGDNELGAVVGTIYYKREQEEWKIVHMDWKNRMDVSGEDE